MELPFLLPQNSLALDKCLSDEELFLKLKDHPLFLITFLEYGSEDEGWSDRHLNFLKITFNWLTEEFLQDRLSFSFAKKVVEIIYGHPFLTRLLEDNISINERGFNTLTLSISSEVLHEVVRIYCKNKKEMNISLNNLKEPFLSLLHEYSQTGSLPNLYRFKKEDLFVLLSKAKEWKTLAISHLIEDVLKRYILLENVIDYLLLSYKEDYDLLKHHCCHFLNEQNLGFQLSSEHEFSDQGEINPLVFEFFEFSDTSMRFFERLHHLITHMVCSGSLTEDANFAKVINEAPRLIYLDISRTKRFSDYLQQMPKSIQGLDLSQCPWLKDVQLKQMISYCPYLKNLILQSNVQLTYLSWGHIQNLKGLEGLDLSRCQLQDEDLILILRGQKGLLYLTLQECKNLTSKSFFELAKNLKHLIHLNLSRSHITDGLLMEIISQCKELQSLDISKCLDLSEKGILQAVKLSQKLKKIVIKDVNFPLSSLKELAPIIIDK